MAKYALVKLTLPSVAKALWALTKESRRERREAGSTVGATAGRGRCSCALLNDLEGDFGGDARRRTMAGANAPIDAPPVNGGTRRIVRRMWANRYVRGVDDDILVVRIREHHRRDKCLA